MGGGGHYADIMCKLWGWQLSYLGCSGRKVQRISVPFKCFLQREAYGLVQSWVQHYSLWSWQTINFPLPNATEICCREKKTLPCTHSLTQCALSYVINGGSKRYQHCILCHNGSQGRHSRPDCGRGWLRGCHGGRNCKTQLNVMSKWPLQIISLQPPFHKISTNFNNFHSDFSILVSILTSKILTKLWISILGGTGISLQ